MEQCCSSACFPQSLVSYGNQDHQTSDGTTHNKLDPPHQLLVKRMTYSWILRRHFSQWNSCSGNPSLGQDMTSQHRCLMSLHQPFFFPHSPLSLSVGIRYLYCTVPGLLFSTERCCRIYRTIPIRESKMAGSLCTSPGDFNFIA